MSEELSVNLETVRLGEGSVLQVFPRGNFLYSQDVQLKDLVSESLEADTRGVIIDLSQIGMMDSSALGLLAALQSHLAKRKVRLVLAGPNPQTRSILQTTGMRGLFMQFETTEDALNYFKKI